MSQGAAARLLGGLALAVTVVGLGSLASLVSFFAVGGVFGPVNDVGNGVLAVLCGTMALAWLYAVPAPGRGLVAATGLAVVGGAVAVVGSVLILVDVTGFFLAGLVS